MKKIHLIPAEGFRIPIEVLEERVPEAQNGQMPWYIMYVPNQEYYAFCNEPFTLEDAEEAVDRMWDE